MSTLEGGSSVENAVAGQFDFGDLPVVEEAHVGVVSESAPVYKAPTPDAAINEQGSFDGMPGAVVRTAKDDLKRPIAFGRIVNPEFWGIDTRDLIPPSPEETLLIGEDAIRHALFCGPPTSKNDHRPIWEKIIWSPAEFSVIVRYPDGIARGARNRLKKENIARKPDDLEAAASRGAAHRLEFFYSRMSLMSDGYDKDVQLMCDLLTEAADPGRAHHLGINMMIMATTTRTILDRMLEAVAISNNWDEETKSKANNALLAQLFTGPQADKVSHWKTYLNLARQYAARKRGAVRRQLPDVGEKISSLYAESERYLLRSNDRD